MVWLYEFINPVCIASDRTIHAIHDTWENSNRKEYISVATTRLDSTWLDSRRLGAVVGSTRLAESKSTTPTRLWSRLESVESWLRTRKVWKQAVLVYMVMYDTIYVQSAEKPLRRPTWSLADRIKAYITSKRGILADIFLKDWSQLRPIQVWNSQNEGIVIVHWIYLEDWEQAPANMKRVELITNYVSRSHAYVTVETDMWVSCSLALISQVPMCSIVSIKERTILDSIKVSRTSNWNTAWVMTRVGSSWCWVRSGDSPSQTSHDLASTTRLGSISARLVATLPRRWYPQQLKMTEGG